MKIKKIQFVINKFKNENKNFPGIPFIHFNKCPKDYGMENAQECESGNHKFSCKKCWSKQIVS